jgi:hypothetical protein
MSIVVSCAFTGANGTTLESYTPDVGGAFAKNTALPPNTAVLANNRLRPAGITAGFYYSSTTPVGAEYDVECDFYSVTPGNDGGIAARVDPTAGTGYLARSQGGSVWDLYKVVAGTFTLLGSFTQALGYATNYHVKLQIRNATKKVFVDGVEVISSSDNSISATGHPGFWMSGADDNNAGVHFDNYTVDDLVAAGLSVTATATPTATGADLTSTPTGGAGGNTYQWHRSTTPNFTPSGGTALGGATTQNYSDTTGTPGTVYVYKVVVTDSASSHRHVQRGRGRGLPVLPEGRVHRRRAVGQHPRPAAARPRPTSPPWPPTAARTCTRSRVRTGARPGPRRPTG